MKTSLTDEILMIETSDNDRTNTNSITSLKQIKYE
jgi:hypothetical protein